LVTVWLVGLGIGAWRQRARLVPAERVVLLYLAVFWLAPLALGSGIALHRAESLLFPSVVLWRRVPRPALLAFAVAGVAIFWAMGSLFFRSALL